LSVITLALPEMKKKDIKRLELHISYNCSNSCVFCSERYQLSRFPGQFVQREIVEGELEKSAKKGFNHVTFTGGESTLHPDIINLVQSAKQLSYKTYLSSNGGLFSSSKFCRKIIPYLDEICFSVHGHNAKLHNFLTKNKQSFSRLKKALANINKSPQDFFCFINIVITKYNFDQVEKIINFVSRYKKVRQVLISNIAPEGNGLKNYKELCVPLGEIKKRVPHIIEAAKNNSLNIRFFGLPFCTLDGYEIYSNDTYWSPRLTLEKWKESGKTIIKRTYSHKPSRNRAHTQKCKECRKKGLCEGAFEEYIKVFGDKELG
jgi:MoaA/NifB/PqqE/SkfB family radical SAM enzyme